MAQNPQDPKDNSSRAVHYLCLNQDDRAPEAPALRPTINVPIDLGYSMQRFVNSHAHIEDRVLRPLQHFANGTPLTEAESRARMAAILAAAAKASAPTR
ncbi:hypothetical protein F5Y08DRAFT_344314 [Xylaria arbuscula]|uniref:Uncharacterized protein n=1 Tax=Xylaria arbuscula TaxID=114810 RepID=A0A9W8TPX9_9PEZI|nr:hypothetical protein F5Y08DRAFT_344314 [Xylaria arbuscula]KAJ3579457.1 hypothetical protein NPX13_g1107 [Xylaria arbuscula]